MCKLFDLQVAMETVHGPKLGSLVGELLQPLDLGKEQLFLSVDVHPPNMFYMPLNLFCDFLR